MAWTRRISGENAPTIIVAPLRAGCVSLRDHQAKTLTI
jgi:hypothetical protein